MRLMRLYGDPISDEDAAALLARLQARGTAEAMKAVETIEKGQGRYATPATTLAVRETIVRELIEWDDLESSAPSLARLRDRLAGGPHQG
jgi:hypothetical protein